jgi:dUTP pyrophosphatase
MIQFKKTLEEAVVPTRAGPNEAGFDLTLVRYVEPVGENAYMFDTGIAVSPPPGYYSIVVPRSSIVKQGVFLSNSVGVIDATYTGSIKVVLSFQSDSPQLLDAFLRKLPLKLCQLLFLPMIPPYIGSVEVQELAPTTRGAGGFGSTDFSSKNNE